MTWPAAAVIAVPCAAGALCFAAPRRARAPLAVVAIAATAVIAGALAVGVARGGSYVVALGGWEVPLAIRLRADGLGAFMVAVQAVVGALISLYALSYFANTAVSAAFWPLWLLLWAALNAVYLAGDLFNAYVALELVGVTAVALVAIAQGEALAAAARYLLVTLLGSLFYLAGVALVYAEAGAVDMEAVAEVMAGSPAARGALALMATGLLLKTAAFPLHFWLPPAHANAAAPASAILSALVIKASFALLVRLWMSVFPEEAGAALGGALGLLGVGAVLWGGAQALVQSRLKMLVAYSTVAQVGYLLMAFSLGGVAWQGAFLFAAAHACAKAAMFLAAGTVKRELGTDEIRALRGVAGVLPVTMFSFALAGIALIGLPPSGGFVGKWLLLVQAADDGMWLYVIAIPAGTLLSVAYVFRVVGPSLAELDEPATRRTYWLGAEVPTLALALAALALAPAASPLVELLEIGAPLGGAP